MDKYSNNVRLIGVISTGFEFVKDFYGEKIYEFTLAISRLSGTIDYLPVQVSNRTMDVSKYSIGDRVCIDGEFRSHVAFLDEKRRLILNLFALKVVTTDLPDDNSIIMRGNICKTPVYRVTPKGKEVCDILLAMNVNIKSWYIPCIAWGRNAGYLADMEVGTNIEFTGRIQSRNFTKDGVERIAYEVSVMGIREDFEDEN